MPSVMRKYSLQTSGKLLCRVPASVAMAVRPAGSSDMRIDAGLTQVS